MTLNACWQRNAINTLYFRIELCDSNATKIKPKQKQLGNLFWSELE